MRGAHWAPVVDFAWGMVPWPGGQHTLRLVWVVHVPLVVGDYAHAMDLGV